MYACSNIKVNFDVINPNASTNQSLSTKRSTEINPHNQLSYSQNDTASFSNSSQSANSSKPEEPKNQTDLFEFSEIDKIKMIDLLLDNGADLTCVNKIGEDVIAMAKHFKMATLYEYMVKIKDRIATEYIESTQEI